MTATPVDARVAARGRAGGHGRRRPARHRPRRAARAASTRATPHDVDRALARPRRGRSTTSPRCCRPPPPTGSRTWPRPPTALTVQRFGRAVRLFAPLYLSNECVSQCTYCGFSAGNDIVRRTLTPDEARPRREALVDRGFRHVLLVAGEHARIVEQGLPRRRASPRSRPSCPSSRSRCRCGTSDTYRRLVDAGCDGLVVYQETYDPATYGPVHLKGKKRNYDWRLAAPDRGAAAGMRRLGIGALLGLHADWRSRGARRRPPTPPPSVRRWWRCEVSVALPRLRPAAGGYEPADPVDDADLVQLLCALRLALPDVGISPVDPGAGGAARRAPPPRRDRPCPPARTPSPAATRRRRDAEPQFAIGDERTPAAGRRRAPGRRLRPGLEGLAALLTGPWRTAASAERAWWLDRVSGDASTWPMPSASPAALSASKVAGSTQRATGRWLVVGRRYWPRVTMSTPTRGAGRPGRRRTSSSVSPMPEDQARLGDQAGRLGPGQHRQRAGVAGRRATARWRRATVSRLWFRTSGRASKIVARAAGVALAVGDQHLDRAAR